MEPQSTYQLQMNMKQNETTERVSSWPNNRHFEVYLEMEVDLKCVIYLKDLKIEIIEMLSNQFDRNKNK